MTKALNRQSSRTRTALNSVTSALLKPFSRCKGIDGGAEPELDDKTKADIDRLAHGWSEQYRSPATEDVARRVMTEAAYAIERDRRTTLGERRSPVASDLPDDDSEVN